MMLRFYVAVLDDAVLQEHETTAVFLALSRTLLDFSYFIMSNRNLLNGNRFYYTRFSCRAPMMMLRLLTKII
jgi:hypothetical protein